MVRVLFVHGLESGPHGSKVRYLKRVFGDRNVYCANMRMSLWRPDRANSLLRSGLREVARRWYRPWAWVQPVAVPRNT